MAIFARIFKLAFCYGTFQFLLQGSQSSAQEVAAAAADETQRQPDFYVKPDGLSCASMLCMQGTYCIEGPPIRCFRAPCPRARPRCVPYNDNGLTCANIRCAAGTHCEQETINCFTTPCPQPPPKCVPDQVNNELTCANMLCPPGTYCQQLTIYCIRAPCPQPPPKCVPCGPPVEQQGSTDRAAQSINPCPIG